MRLLAALALLVVMVLGSFGPVNFLEQAQAAPSAPSQFRYFEQTGHSISGPIWSFYNRTGGEERHGFPLTELIMVKGNNSERKYQQFFERSVLEFNPDYVGTDREVKQLPLGVMQTSDRTFAPVTPFPNNLNQWYFPETGHSLSFGFLDYWLNHGQLDSLGLPISEEMEEVDTGGQKLNVQYFEYAKLEYHAELAGTDKSVQLAQLGRKQAEASVSAGDLASIPQAKLSQSRSVRIPSLMFHYVRNVDAKKDPLGFGLSVTQDNFVKYLDWIQQNGYNTVTIEQISDYLHYGIPLPEKPVNIRFDDGHADQWFAYQEMKKRGMTATFFVITQRLELTPAQWQQVDADGFEVAAHTRTHPDLRGVKDLEGEITGSKRDLEAMLGHPVRSFAYPYGKYGPTILQIVRNSGFDVAASTNGGYGWTPENYFIEPTLSVTGSDNVISFAAKIKGAANAPLTNSVTVEDTTKPASATTKAPAKVTTVAPKNSSAPAKLAPTPKK
jgi:peptidoglycan/xylan/chitin deacetylase (PgdA/CDA1 family)